MRNIKWLDDLIGDTRDKAESPANRRTVPKEDEPPPFPKAILFGFMVLFVWGAAIVIVALIKNHM